MQWSILFLLLFSHSAMARDLKSLNELLTLVFNQNKFLAKTHEHEISRTLNKLDGEMTKSSHPPRIIEEFRLGRSWFEEKKRPGAQWKLKEVSRSCLNCHNKDMNADVTTFKEDDSRGIFQLLIGRLPEAKLSFKKSPLSELRLKQLLMIDVISSVSPVEIDRSLSEVLKQKNLEKSLTAMIAEWRESLEHWKHNSILIKGIESEAQALALASQTIGPIGGKMIYKNPQINLLFSYALLKKFLEKNPDTLSFAEISYWLGRSIKYLRKEGYQLSEDVFLKECVYKSPAHPYARKCFEEYKQSTEERFLKIGPIPREVEKDLRRIASVLSSSV